MAPPGATAHGCAGWSTGIKPLGRQTGTRGGAHEDASAWPIKVTHRPGRASGMGTTHGDVFARPGNERFGSEQPGGGAGRAGSGVAGCVGRGGGGGAIGVDGAGRTVIAGVGA